MSIEGDPARGFAMIVTALLVVAVALVGPSATPSLGQDEGDTGAPETPDGAPAIDDLVAAVRHAQSFFGGA